MNEWKAYTYINVDGEVVATWLATENQSFIGKLSLALTGHELSSIEDLNRVLSDQGRGEVFPNIAKSFVNYLEI